MKKCKEEVDYEDIDVLKNIILLFLNLYFII